MSLSSGIVVSLVRLVGVKAARNAFALDIDYQEEPPMFKVSDTHFAATWLLDERAPKVTPPSPILKRGEKWSKMKEK